MSLPFLCTLAFLTSYQLKEWTSYASWEASQGEFDRSRSVYERALDVDARSVQLWLRYVFTSSR